jgi:pSer/pThr/pTyr-binding forkhead associated (FHA) protein
MPKLTVILPDGSEQSHDLIDDHITIGRVADNMLQIDDVSVSSHHATLIFTGADYVYRDIGSTNGSRLNGRDLEADTDYNLQDGDRLRIGKVEAVYASENPAEARPLPEEQEVSLAPAASSAAPTNFQNASPFQTKKKKKDPAGTAMLVLGSIALLAGLAAIARVLSIQPPA